ncbi:MAG: hypothetical protein BWY08_00470 [Bacteroidetes bacterium ADurb.Bin174]|nr:MAG: hypothetical protein BWY08_00470 [Bacteroidetes bacterium ADurb.Bin174]
MVGAKGKNIFIFLLFACTFSFQQDIFVRTSLFKKKGGYPWDHKTIK